MPVAEPPAGPKPGLDIFAPPPNPFGPGVAVSVVPDALRVDLVLTALTPISHHDPAAQDESNTLLFNRAKVLVPGAQATQPVPEGAVRRLAESHPAPEGAAELLDGRSPGEFAAVALVRCFLDLHNGQGLMDGTDRYQLLETRLRSAAVRSAHLPGLWSRMCHDLRAPIHGADRAERDAEGRLFSLLSLPGALQQAALRACERDYRHVVAYARHWHAEQKRGSEAYADAAGVDHDARPPRPVELAPWSPSSDASALVLEVPQVSSNTLRHQILRGPGTRHLFAALDLPWGFAGDGSLPLGAEAVFANGGNIRSGSKQPSDPFGLAWEARRAHPLLDLLGGVTDSFDLGESRAKVAGWLVCREFGPALLGTPAESLPAASVSAFDLLDDVTATRQATDMGVGQMIYSFETLCAGAQVFCRLSLSPFTDRRTVGALAAALSRFTADGAVIGGQSARGHGWMRAEVVAAPPGMAECCAEYEAYLAENRDALRQGLMEGTLGARVKVVS